MSVNKLLFSDSEHETVVFPSAWRVASASASIECQTSPELYLFEEAEVQTGPSTNVMQSEVSSKFSGKTLLQFLSKTKKHASAEEWEERILKGTITVDMEVVTDPHFAVEEDFFIEYVDYRRDAAAQTEPPESEESKESEESHPALMSFLRRAEPLICEQLVQNASSRAFDGYHISTQFSSAKIQLWNSLSVNLEQRKVIFPDWGRGEHYKGTIAHCSLTRNKERVYDVEYRDTGVYDRINGVRGEYIRVFDDSNVRTVATVHGSRATSVLKEGIRVHVKMAADKKSRGDYKFYPGRVVAVHRSGTIDVECNERALNGLTPSDVILGLEQGYNVEARQPTHVQLQCTGVSWTCSGGAVAVSYGRNDITGWCDFPGAVCVWSIFDKSFQVSEPQFVFDHPSCIMCVSFHPVSPSIVAGGSFNGEVVIWNLNEPEKAMCMTTIDSPYSHKEPVLDLKWVYDSNLKRHLLASAGADGKLLFWDVDNNLVLPVRGVVITKNKEKRNYYPASHGGTAVAFTSTPASHRVEWVLVGQEGGGIARGQMSRISNLPRIAENQTVSDDIYPAMRRTDDSFNYEAHVGPVQTVEGSPFHRYLFLTGGNDGIVRLYHVLERTPLFEWEPSPPPGTPGLSGKLFGAVTAVQFSPVSPVVFATSSSEGFVYFFNLAVSTTGPISWVQVPAPTSAASGKKRAASMSTSRPGITGISFNSRQRDMFAACDSSGNVHVWKMDWSLSNARPMDQSVLDRLGSVKVDSAADN